MTKRVINPRSSSL